MSRRRFQTPPDAARTIAALVALRDQVIAPILAGVRSARPVCERCRKRWITCSRCGTGGPLQGGTLREPLCARCLNPDPAFWKRCAACQVTWQLSTAECTRCSLDRKLQQIFTPPGGPAAPELNRLREALVRVDRPDLMLDWLKKAGVRRTLQAVAARGAVTHETLDALPGRTSSTCGRCWSPRVRSRPGTSAS